MLAPVLFDLLEILRGNYHLPCVHHSSSQARVTPVHDCAIKPIQVLEYRVIGSCNHTHFSVTAWLTIPGHSLGNSTPKTNMGS